MLRLYHLSWYNHHSFNLYDMQGDRLVTATIQDVLALTRPDVDFPTNIIPQCFSPIFSLPTPDFGFEGHPQTATLRYFLLKRVDWVIGKFSNSPDYFAGMSKYSYQYDDAVEAGRIVPLWEILQQDDRLYVPAMKVTARTRYEDEIPRSTDLALTTGMFNIDRLSPVNPKLLAKIGIALQGKTIPKTPVYFPIFERVKTGVLKDIDPSDINNATDTFWEIFNN